MKKILFTFGVIGLLIVAACDTPQPTTNPGTGDSAVNNNTQTDTSTSRPDSTQNR